MVAFDARRVAIIRSWPGTIILAAALLAHAGLAIAKFVARRTLKMPGWETTQIALGLLIPMLLVPTHIGLSDQEEELFLAFGSLSPGEFASLLGWPSGTLQRNRPY